uniref:Putative NOT transcription complex subunit VIP2 n=1 Tax=Noccaea caerulescens TaxID=107243 RepID=A0A1J3HUC2_NOCCA
MSNLHSSLNGSASNLQDGSGRSFAASYSGQSGAPSPAFHHTGNLQGLHNLHGSYNVGNMQGTLTSRNSSMNSIPSAGVQQANGSFSSGRFASNNLPVALSQLSHGSSHGHSEEKKRTMEEGASEMELEVQNRQLSDSSSAQPVKKFGLKNSIPTNFGSDYVFQIVPKVDWTAIAVSLSTNTVKLYSPVTGQYYGECKGHSDTVNQIAFSSDSAASPNVLHSCSSDGTIRSWDTRCFQQILCIDAENDQKIFSFSYGGAGDHLLAGACNEQVLLWDWRNSKQVACLEESHMDDVTQVHFAPHNRNKLLSASVDGLICLFNTEGAISDDDHLESVINVGTSIGKIGFLGDCYQKLWCLTHIETLSIWNWQDGSCQVNLENARELASDSWSQDNVDYFVDCHSPGGEDLWVIGGTCAGTIGYFPVDYKRPGSMGSAEAILGGGHVDVVRSVLQMPCEYGGAAGLFGWTGGEDGRLCCWRSDENSAENNQSWTSSELVVKTPKNRKENRHSPY